MKKIAAILLLGILLFNWLGYRILTSYLQSRADNVMVMALDQNDYDETALVSFKVPVNLPYYMNSGHYQRVDGVIIVDGVHYNYVKRRVYNDSLEYLCIPNHQKTKLGHASDAFFKLVNDVQQPQKEKTGGNHFTKHFSSEYLQDNTLWSSPSFTAGSTKCYSSYTASLSKTSLPPAEQPPDAGCMFT